MACKCEGCNNPNCSCTCEDVLDCECKGCGLKLDDKVINPSDKFYCEGCGG